MQACIHHFNFKINEDPDGFFDDDGDPLNGYYFEITDDEGTPLHQMMGPYRTFHEAEEACCHAWSHNVPH